MHHGKKYRHVEQRDYQHINYRNICGNVVLQIFWSKGIIFTYIFENASLQSIVSHACVNNVQLHILLSKESVNREF